MRHSPRKFWEYVARRVLLLIFLLVGVTIITFILLQVFHVDVSYLG
jgi:ABC-type dipeptide/oligopeptide/nickel transport system permease component